MTAIFYTPTERRYEQHPRRWLNEYHCDGRRAKPDAHGACATLHSARRQAVMAVDQNFCTVVRIFDRLTGKYKFTYKASPHGPLRHEGYKR